MDSQHVLARNWFHSSRNCFDWLIAGDWKGIKDDLPIDLSRHRLRLRSLLLIENTIVRWKHFAWSNKFLFLKFNGISESNYFNVREIFSHCHAACAATSSSSRQYRLRKMDFYGELNFFCARLSARGLSVTFTDFGQRFPRSSLTGSKSAGDRELLANCVVRHKYLKLNAIWLRS